MCPDNGVCVWCAVETLTVVSQGHLNIGKGIADVTCQAVDGRIFKNLKQGKVIADKSRQRILRAGQQQRMRASFNQVVIWLNIVILDQPGPDAGDVCCKLLSSSDARTGTSCALADSFSLFGVFLFRPRLSWSIVTRLPRAAIS